METAPGEIEQRLARRIRGLRARHAMSLDELARRSGVSRSMISLIERAESSPTASVLDRLAVSLGVTLAALFAEDPRPDAPPLARRSDQPAWSDPDTGYVRRNLSPPGFPSMIELVEVTLPPGTTVAYDSGTRLVRVDQQIWMLEGAMAVTAAGATHHLAAGDTLAMRLDGPTRFRNQGDAPSRHLVATAVAALPGMTAANLPPANPPLGPSRRRRAT